MKKGKIIRGRRQNPRKKSKLILALIIVFGFIFVMGGVPLFLGLQEVVGAFSSSKWPSVNGAITHSEVKVTENRNTGSSSRQKNYSYQPDIRYKYEVSETSHVGDNVRFGQISNREIAGNIVAKYKPGSKIKVYYNPNNHRDSVLEPGISFGMLLMPLLGLFVVGCGIVGLIIYFKYFWES